jgi:hypothetical protein
MVGAYVHVGMGTTYQGLTHILQRGVASMSLVGHFPSPSFMPGMESLAPIADVGD